MTLPVDDSVLSRETGREVAAVLVHLKKLLRVRNQLHSPLLRLPTEVILRILSFIMGGLSSYTCSYVWESIYGTCHRIYKIMCSATELWWRVDCTRVRMAHFILMRSKGNPRVVVSDLRPVNDGRLAATERFLDHWRDKQRFRGHWLHTLEFIGSPSSFDHFSWILERSLPEVQRLKIHVTDSFDEYGFRFTLRDPVTVELPMDMPLQVLDLCNVTLPWSTQSRLFDGLRELHLDFKDCDPAVVIPENELFGILDASPQLERLSLVQVGHEVLVENGEPLPPKRVLQLPNLVSLTLDNNPVTVKYTLAYMGLPVIASLKIRSPIPWDITQTLISGFFPDDRLPERLFPNPPTFAVRIAGTEGLDARVEIDIGSIELRFDFPHEDEFGRHAIMSCASLLVPPSVTALKLEYTQLDEQGWRDFFASHPEVLSIECTEFFQVPVSRSLWDALSSAGEDTGVLCPRLESISITSYTGDVVFTSLSDCLRSRQTAGFKLGRLQVVDYHRLMVNVDGFYEEFCPLVEVVEAGKPGRFMQRWGRAIVEWEQPEI